MKRILWLTASLIVFVAPCLAYAASIDKEGLVTIVDPPFVKPAFDIVIQPGQQQATVHLEVLFGSASNGVEADPNTFSPRFSRIKRDDLAAMFSDIVDGNGKVIGKQADVIVPFFNPKKKYAFKAKVTSQPFLIGTRFKVLRDADKAKIRLVPNQTPVISNLRVSNAIGQEPGGAWRVNAGQPTVIEADLSDPDGGLVTSYDVEFGDGAMAADQSAAGFQSILVQHSYDPDAGPIQVVVRASDGSFTATESIDIVLNRPPIAALRTFPSEGSFLYPIIFDGLDSTDPDGDALEYMFDFGNGSTSPFDPNAQLVQIYPKPGQTKVTYAIGMTVRDSGGLTSSTSGEILVRTALTGEPMLTVVSPLKNETVPVGTFLPVFVDVNRASSGAEVDLGTLVATLNGVDVAQFYTPITDSNRNNAVVELRGEIPLQFLSQTSNNNIKVQIKSQPFIKIGQSSPTTVKDTDYTRYVRITTNLPPIASFNVSPSAPLTSDLVTFDASGSSDPEGSPLDFSWNFGDGTTLETSTAITTHSYAVEGVFQASLTVSDESWNIAATPILIPVLDADANMPMGDPVLEIPEIDPNVGLDFGTLNSEIEFIFVQGAFNERVVEVRNTGDGVLSFSPPQISGGTGTPFSIRNGTSIPSLRAGESHFIDIEFGPALNQPAQNFSRQLMISSNAGNVSIPLKGSIAAVPIDFDSVLITHNVNLVGPSALIDFGPTFTTKVEIWKAFANQAVDIPAGGLPFPWANIYDFEILGADKEFFSAEWTDTDDFIFLRPGDSGKVNDAISITFDPGAVTTTKRFSARLRVTWDRPTAFGTGGRVDGPPFDIALTGIASQNAVMTFTAPALDFERKGSGNLSTMLGSAKSGLTPAGVTATYLAGREVVTGSTTITPIYPPGNTAFTALSTNWTIDPNTLDPTNPTAFFPVEFRGPSSGHYSALLTVNPNPAHLPPVTFLMHGYAKGDNNIGILGTPESVYFVDEDNFSQFSTEEDFSARVIGLGANGAVSNNGKGFGDLAILVDPFTIAGLEVGTDQWQDERSDVVIVNDEVFAIDSDVLDHTLCDADLTTHACDRITAGGIGTGVIVHDEDLLAGVESSAGDVDLRWDESIELELDATSDGAVFFTESGASSMTRLRWYHATLQTFGVVSEDLNADIGAIPGMPIEDLRVVRNGTAYRVFVLMDDGSLYEADINATRTSVTGFAALSPSSTPDSTMVLDGAGNWYSAEGDGSTLQVCRESLHDGAGSRICMGQVNLITPDQPFSVLVDGSSNVLVETGRGIVKFASTGPSTLEFQGYVLLGSVYASDSFRGDDPDGDKSADIDLDFDRLWLSK